MAPRRKRSTNLFNKHLRDSGVPGEALKRKLNKDISFALRRGTIAQVTTALDAAQRAAEAELAASPTASASQNIFPLLC